MRSLAGFPVRATALRFSVLLCAVLAGALLSVAVPVMAQETEPTAPEPVVMGRGTTIPHYFYTNSYALIIGVSRYKNGMAKLVYPSADATALRDLLVKRYDFPAENITLLLDEQATKANIEKALAGYSNERKVKTTDRLLIFFSGHGQTVKLASGGDMGFLIPYDANVDRDHPDDRSGYLSTCLRMDTLWGFLEACSARHCLLIADACYGGFLAQSRSLVEPPSEQMLANLLSRSGRQAITAGGAGETVVEDPSWGHGALTYKLIEELNAQATTPGTVFLASQLATTLKTSVGNLTGGKQTPQYGAYNGAEGDFIFYSVGLPTSSPGLSVSTGKEPERPTALPTAATNQPADAEAALEKGDTAKAIAIYTTLLAAHPDDYDLYAGRGSAFYAAEQYETAATDFTKCITLRPTAIEGYLYRAYAYRYTDKYTEALEDLEKVEALDATRIDYALRGRLHLIQEDYDKAIADLSRKEAQIGEDRFYCLFFLGDAYYFKQDYARARQQYTQAIAVSPRNPLTYLRRGWLGIYENKISLAVQDFNRVVLLDPTDPANYYSRGFAYLQLDTPSGNRSAEADFEKYLSLSTDHEGRLNATKYLGEVQAENGKNAAALVNLNRVLTANPTDDALSARGWVLVNLHQYAAAMRDFKNYITHHPDGDFVARAYLGMGMIYWNLPKRDMVKAEQMTTAALSVDPSLTEVHALRAKINAMLKRYKAIPADTEVMIRSRSSTASEITTAWGMQGIAYAAMARQNGEDRTLLLKAVTAIKRYIALSPGDTQLARLSVFDPQDRAYAQTVIRRYGNLTEAATKGKRPPPFSKPKPRPVALPETRTTTSAQLLSHAAPNLPESLSRADLKPVRVRFTIAASGSCVYEILTGSGDLNVDATILQACANFRWQPAVKDGKAIDSKLIYVFDLKE